VSSGYVADDNTSCGRVTKSVCKSSKIASIAEEPCCGGLGRIWMPPYIGRVAAADKTWQQLAAEMKDLLEKEYYYHATVIIGWMRPTKSSGAFTSPARSKIRDR